MRRFLVLILAAGTLACAEETQAPPPEGEALTLGKAIELALTRNLDLEVERLNPKIAEQGMDKGRGAFDPVLSASYKDNDARAATTSSLSGAPIVQQRTTTYAAGAKEKLMTGTTLDLSLSYVRQLTNSIFSTVNPSHTSGATLSVKQPLLKGLGIDVNRADITTATLSREAARHAFEAKVTETVAAVEAAYWDLVAALDDILVKQDALKAAQALETTNQAKAEAGTLPRTDVLAASSAAASREADLIDAERKAADAQDRLRQLVDPGSSPRPYLPMEKPSTPELVPDVDAGTRRALEHRPELAQARAVRESALVSRMVAQDALQPDLSLSGSWGQQGVDADREDSFSRLNDGRARTWELGLAVEMPLGFRSAKSDLRKSEAQVDQETARLKSLEQKVVTEVRAAARAVESGKRRVEASDRAVTLASEQLRAERLRYEQGISTTQTVLEAMKTETAERGRSLSALVDCLKAVSAWHKAQASLLEFRGIRLE